MNRTSLQTPHVPEKACELEAKARRARAVAKLRERLRRQGPLLVEVPPEALIREDRDHGSDRMQVDSNFPEGT